LGAAALQSSETEAQVGHDPGDLHEQDVKPPPGGPAGEFVGAGPSSGQAPSGKARDSSRRPFAEHGVVERLESVRF
jgi:hypothetical protein